MPIHVVGAPLSSADRFTVSGCVILRDSSAIGIQRVVVKDRFGVLLLDCSLKCTDLTEIRIPPVERERLPLTVEAYDLEGQEFAATQVIWGTPAETKFSLPSLAFTVDPDPSWKQAEVDAMRARNRVVTALSDYRIAVARRRFAALTAAGLATSAIFCFVAAFSTFTCPSPVVQLLIAPLFSGLGAATAFAAVTQAFSASRQSRELREAEKRMAALRSQYDVAVDRVMETSRGGWGVDLNQP